MHIGERLWYTHSKLNSFRYRSEGFQDNCINIEYTEECQRFVINHSSRNALNVICHVTKNTSEKAFPHNIQNKSQSVHECI